jgi:hypothetical protein
MDQEKVPIEQAQDLLRRKMQAEKALRATPKSFLYQGAVKNSTSVT